MSEVLLLLSYCGINNRMKLSEYYHNPQRKKREGESVDINYR